MYKVLIFAGTVEGRTLAEHLAEKGYEVHVCVATEYGESLLPKHAGLHISHKRLSRDEMEEKMERLGDAPVVDATHPYAAEVTENIRGACERTGKTYIRLLRDTQKIDEKDCVRVESVSGAVEYLKQTQGNIFLTTGSKELRAFTEIEDYRERVFARVLSLPKVVEACSALGFEGKHLICMQGPFSKELNTAMLRQFDAKYLVTKDTGAAGGFLEKYEAAREAGAVTVIIGRPLAEEGVSLEECEALVQRLLGEPECPGAQEEAQEIALIGIGMGSAGSMTVEARDFCRSADVLIGASRMLESVQLPDKPRFVSYKPQEIADFIASHPAYRRVAVLLSGDVGFYSGAKKLFDLFGDRLTILPGIASPVYFCDKLRVSWEDVCLASVHGRKNNLVGLCRKHAKVFALVGNSGGISELCRKLCGYGMSGVRVHIGERLSYPDEKISSGTPGDFSDYETDGLSVVLLENPQPERVVTPGIPDEAFLRDKVPMTKEEVREICMCKLRLTEDAVVYDIGGGTGSVSIEAARLAVRGTVYSIEKNPSAVALMRENKKKFAADNLEIIEGLAPGALRELPAPTHAFLGGTSGNLAEIMELLYEKNPSLRVVITAITLETVAEAVRYFKGNPRFEEPDIAQISAAKGRTAGSYHLMMGQNPVYIISSTGNGNTADERGEES